MMGLVLHVHVRVRPEGWWRTCLELRTAINRAVPSWAEHGGRAAVPRITRTKGRPRGARGAGRGLPRRGMLFRGEQRNVALNAAGGNRVGLAPMMAQKSPAGRRAVYAAGCSFGLTAAMEGVGRFRGSSHGTGGRVIVGAGGRRRSCREVWPELGARGRLCVHGARNTGAGTRTDRHGLEPGREYIVRGFLDEGA